MKLKYLELYGFKSFAEKTKLVFEKDISAIVGPNGSGKSNISDAIRWVLGEQSVKSLRGSKMEDVIFSGTDTKKQMNMAQVSITVDNSDKSLPIDFDLVNVTRRVYRTGDSEYLINNSQVRLKDIKELFLDTGIGKDGYSIIGQGRIDDILNGRNEDRRYIFEEACGISKNKYKKTEAERKLVKNEENLKILKDELKIKEQETEILRKQAENAKEGSRLSLLLEKMELSLLKQNIDKINLELEKDKSKLEYGKLSFEEKFKELEKLKEKLNPSLEKLERLDLEYNKLKENLISKDKRRERLLSEVNILEEKSKFYLSDIKRISNDIENRANKIEENKKNISDLKEKLEKLAISRKDLEKQVQEKKAEIEDIEINRRAYSGKMKAILEEISEKREALIRLNIDKSTKEKLDISNKELKENYQAEMDSLNKDIELIEEDLSSIEKQLKELDKREAGLENLSSLLAKKSNLNKEIEALSLKLNDAKNDYYSHQSQRDVLYRLYTSYDGFYKPIQNLLREAARNKDISSRLVGVLADLIEVDPKYRIALDVCLSSSLQNIVVENEQDAKYLIDFIKNKNYGRITFLPISKIEAKTYDINHRLAINTMNKLLKYEPKISGIINHFLSRTILVKDMADAIQLSKELKGFRLVTLDGEIINSWGSMVGGNLYKKDSTSLINRKKEIENLDIYLNNKEKELESIISNLEDLRKEENNLDLEIGQVQEKRSTIAEEKNILLGKEREAKINREFKISRLDEFKNLFLKAKEDLKDKDFSQIGFLELDIKNLEEIYEKNQSQDKALVEKTQFLERERIKLDSNLDILTRDYLQWTNSIENLNIDIENDTMANKTDENNLNITRKFQEEALKNIEEAKSGIVSLDGEDKKDSIYLEELTEKIDQLKAENKTESSRMENLKEELRVLEQENFKINLKVENADQKISDFYQAYKDSYGLDKEEVIERFKGLELVKASRKEIQDIKNQLSKIGYYNYETIDQYRIAKEDLDFTKNQLEDLVKSRDDILNIIKTIEKDMVETFNESFEKINERFKKIFEVLFDGGTASVKLDGPDVLTAGIEIIARPSGKKLKNLALLSGGEKALTAVALMFAIFEINPAPFCVLDEIDAALDEANIGRYINYLKSMVEKTQFIMITHRKVTMEMAEILYGVTMEEKGVSKIITLALDKYWREDV